MKGEKSHGGKAEFKIKGIQMRGKDEIVRK